MGNGRYSLVITKYSRIGHLIADNEILITVVCKIKIK